MRRNGTAESKMGWLTAIGAVSIMPALPPPHCEPAAMTQHQKLDPTTIHDTPAKVSDLLNQIGRAHV